MKATFISREKDDVKFTMEFTAEDLEGAIIKAYQKNKDQYQVDGFRKGKAPRSIIEKRYGENVFLEEAINTLFNQAYPNAVDDLDLDVIDAPRAEFSDIKKGQGFTTTITVAVYPEIKVENYTGVEIEKISAETTDEDVEAELKTMQERNSRMVDVDRAAKEGDMVILDYKGFVGDKQFEGGTAENFPLELGSGSFIPGFEDQLIGIEKDEERDVKVTFPDEYHSKELEGKEAVFKCKVHEIKEKELPELDDEFAKDVSEFDTLDELKEDMKKKIQETKEDHVKTQMQDKVLEAVYNSNDIDVPDVMVQDEITNMMQEFDQQLRGQGLELNKYMEMIGKDPAAFRDELKDDAFKRVKTRMLVSAVAQQENLEATEEDIDEQIDAMAQQYGMDKDKIKEMIGPENLSHLAKDLVLKKAVDFMFDKAVVK